MKVSFEPWTPPGPEVGLLAIGMPSGTRSLPVPLEGLPTPVRAAIERVLGDGSFRGKRSETLVLNGVGVEAGDPAAGPTRFALVGLGRPERLDGEVVRRAAGASVRAAEALSRTSVGLLLLPADSDGTVGASAVQAAAEGLVLAAWDFRELKGPPSEPEKAPSPRVEVGVVCAVAPGPDAADAGRLGATVAAAENRARRLQALPGNLMTPTILAAEAESLASEFGLAFRAMGPEEMAEEGMGAILAVSRGSTEEPRLIILEHLKGREGDPPLVLVGKGLTFDAGGISIKPSLGMEEMKFDMSGGAAVIAAMTAIAELDVPANVVGVVPSSENLPSGSAVKPGDVIRTRSGKTVAVLNTDAEGRLILCDALSWATDLKPAAIVDCATLTGAVVIALGHHGIALLGTDERLVDEVLAAGESTGERCWELPLWDGYREQLDHEVADLKNIGGRPAGTITAAWFLREFVGDTPWAHLDIAGTAYGNGNGGRPYLRTGGYGVPTRLLVEWVRSRAGTRG